MNLNQTFPSIIAILVLACGCRLDCSGDRASLSPDQDRAGVATKIRDAGPMVQCPLCGLRFGQGEAAASMVHEGHRYYFDLKDHASACERDPALCFGRDAGTGR